MKCPKCKSENYKRLGCCSLIRIKCKDCGFSAPEKYFKIGKLPSEVKKVEEEIKEYEKDI